MVLRKLELESSTVFFFFFHAVAYFPYLGLAQEQRVETKERENN